MFDYILRIYLIILYNTTRISHMKERSRNSQIGVIVLRVFIYGRFLTTYFGPRGPSSRKKYIQNYYSDTLSYRWLINKRYHICTVNPVITKGITNN
jgi:hypothetical protein